MDLLVEKRWKSVHMSIFLNLHLNLYFAKRRSIRKLLYSVMQTRDYVSETCLDSLSNQNTATHFKIKWKNDQYKILLLSEAAYKWKQILCHFIWPFLVSVVFLYVLVRQILALWIYCLVFASMPTERSKMASVVYLKEEVYLRSFYLLDLKGFYINALK